MSQITFHNELDPKMNKFGLQEIRIRMTQARKHKRFNVGYAIKKTEWNAEAQQVSKAHNLYIIINAAIKTKRQEIEEEYLKSIPLKQHITLSQLYRKAKSDILGISYIAYYQDYVTTKVPNGGTEIAFLSVLNKLKTFIKNKDLHFEEITFEFIQQFLHHLQQIGNSTNTVHNNFKTVRSIYNHAVKERKFTPTFVSPFYGHDVKRKKVVRNKLDATEIERLENLEIKPNIQKYHAKNFFLLSYYLLGVRSSSMIKMKWENIVGDRCLYQPAKGQSMQNVKIGKKAREILDIYEAKHKTKPDKNEYIFNFMRGCKNLKGKDLIKKISAINTNINNQLAEISAELQLNKKITTHVARHSFAYNARIKSNSSVVVTEAYFESEDNSDADNLSSLMFD
jgi:site-specific recombinase XerD